ncbi:MAG: RES domain-containing protein [Verrucomicrobia bacterium]|nr:RES domain-containing protein [Verrucomicrobiota bacterium]
MTLTAYRLCLKRFAAARAFLGEGARRAGGRWNSPGVAVVYASESLSLASLEFLAHFDSVQDVPELVYFRLEFDERLVATLEQVPEDWRQVPPPASTQAVGDAWAKRRRSAVLRVPSVIIPREYNFVLNPTHPDFGRIAIGPASGFTIDPRLVD